MEIKTFPISPFYRRQRSSLVVVVRSNNKAHAMLALQLGRQLAVMASVSRDIRTTDRSASYFPISLVLSANKHEDNARLKTGRILRVAKAVTALRAPAATVECRADLNHTSIRFILLSVPFFSTACVGLSHLRFMFTKIKERAERKKLGSGTSGSTYQRTTFPWQPTCVHSCRYEPC